MTVSELQLLMNALSFAAAKHREQRRKGVEATPYINHPIAVTNVLVQKGNITETVVLCAALLHDTIEDTETSLSELKESFGEEIATIVKEVTDDKSLPKEVRKRLQVEHASGLSPAAKLVKIADKICNVRDITTSPPADWPPQRRQDYLTWSEKVIAGCRDINPKLDHAFDQAILRARQAAE